MLGREGHSVRSTYTTRSRLTTDVSYRTIRAALLVLVHYALLLAVTVPFVLVWNLLAGEVGTFLGLVIALALMIALRPVIVRFLRASETLVARTIYQPL